MSHDWDFVKTDICNCFHCRLARDKAAEKAKAEDMAARPVDLGEAVKRAREAATGSREPPVPKRAF